mgnify:CR=1 FL=1
MNKEDILELFRDIHKTTNTGTIEFIDIYKSYTGNIPCIEYSLIIYNLSSTMSCINCSIDIEKF